MFPTSRQLTVNEKYFYTLYIKFLVLIFSPASIAAKPHVFRMVLPTAWIVLYIIYFNYSRSLKVLYIELEVEFELVIGSEGTNFRVSPIRGHFSEGMTFWVIEPEDILRP